MYILAIIIPAWNCDNTIAEMLDSIIANSFMDWQAYIIDDQSTDQTAVVVKQYEEKDNRIHYYLRDRLPKGAQTCRNIGFEKSLDAQYVIWLDADDIIAPYCLEQRVDFMEKHPNLDFGIFPAKTFNNNIWDRGNGKVYGFPIYKDTLKAMLHWTLPMVGWTNIYRRDSLIRNKLQWDEKILSMQDSDFNIRALCKKLVYEYAVSYGAKIDYFYRVSTNEQAVSSKLFSRSHFRSHLCLISNIVSSMSKEQRRNYNQDLEIYIYQFMNMMYRKDNDCFYSLANLLSYKYNLNYLIRIDFIKIAHHGWGKFMVKWKEKSVFYKNEWIKLMDEIRESKKGRNELFL